MGRKQWILVGKVVIGLVTALLALGFVWSISAHQTRHTVEAEYRAQERAERTVDDIQKACVGIEQPTLLECITQQIEAGRDDQRAERDLSAQERMADWAFYAMLAGLGTLAMTGVTVYFIRETLEATREAVEDTSNATEAMIAANKIADEAARGWVTVSIEKIGPLIRGQDQRLHVTVKYCLKNVGGSPIIAGAHLPKVYHSAGPNTERVRNYFDLLDSLRKSGMANTGLAPGEELTFEPTIIVDEAELITSEDGGLLLQMFVGIIYQTRTYNGSSFKRVILMRAGGIPSRPGPWTVEQVEHLILGGALT